MVALEPGGRTSETIAGNPRSRFRDPIPRTAAVDPLTAPTTAAVARSARARSRSMGRVGDGRALLNVRPLVLMIVVRWAKVSAGQTVRSGGTEANEPRYAPDVIHRLAALSRIGGPTRVGRVIGPPPIRPRAASVLLVGPNGSRQPDRGMVPSIRGVT